MTALYDEIVTILSRGGIANPATEAARIVQAAQASTPSDHANTGRAMAERRVAGAPLAIGAGLLTRAGPPVIDEAGAREIAHRSRGTQPCCGRGDTPPWIGDGR